MTTSHHDLRQALNEARAAFTRLTDVFEATLGELGRVNAECERLNTENEIVSTLNSTLRADLNTMRDRVWTVESERDNATADVRQAIAARDTALASLALAQDEIKKLRDVILNVAVAIDNEVKTDPKPTVVGAEWQVQTNPIVEELNKPYGRSGIVDPSGPIPAASLSEQQERENDEAIHGYRPAYA